MRPDGPGMRLTSLGMRPDSLGMRLTSLGMRPTSLGMRPTSLGMRPNNLGMRPNNLGLRSTNLTTKPLLYPNDEYFLKPFTVDPNDSLFYVHAIFSSYLVHATTCQLPTSSAASLSMLLYTQEAVGCAGMTTNSHLIPPPPSHPPHPLPLPVLVCCSTKLKAFMPNVLIQRISFYATLTSLIPRPLSEFVSQSWEKQFLCDFKIKSGTKDRICLTVWSTEQVIHKQNTFKINFTMILILCYFCMYLILVYVHVHASHCLHPSSVANRSALFVNTGSCGLLNLWLMV